MTAFLVTNDDGVTSPLLPLLVEELRGLGEVRVVAPASEQSWQGKSMTRFETLQVERLEKFGEEAFSVTGTPSDCVNLGVHSLFPAHPDWVISGINVGRNVGLSFLLNSGTVGGAFEAALLGIPAVAFSLNFAPLAFRQWSEDGKISDGDAIEDMHQAAAWAARIMKPLLARGLPAGAMLINVNFPRQLTPETPVRWTRLQNNRCGSLFEPYQGGFRHSYRGEVWNEAGENMDVDILNNGEISVTPLTLTRLDLSAESYYSLQ